MTLYESIMLCLKRHGKSKNEIEWVGSNRLEIPLNCFFELAKKITDNRSYSYVFLASDIIIVGNNFWLERNPSADEVNGFDKNIWCYFEKPQKPKLKVEISAISLSQLPNDAQKRLLDNDQGIYPTLDLLYNAINL